MKRFSLRVYSSKESKAQDKVTSINVPKNIIALFCLMNTIPAQKAGNAIYQKVQELKDEYIDAYPELGSKGLAEYIRHGLIQGIIDPRDYEEYLGLYEVL